MFVTKLNVNSKTSYVNSSNIRTELTPTLLQFFMTELHIHTLLKDTCNTKSNSNLPCLNIISLYILKRNTHSQVKHLVYNRKNVCRLS